MHNIVRRLLDRDQIRDEEATMDDEEDDEFLKAFKVLFTLIIFSCIHKDLLVELHIRGIVIVLLCLSDNSICLKFMEPACKLGRRSMAFIYPFIHLSDFSFNLRLACLLKYLWMITDIFFFFKKLTWFG